MSLKRLRSMVFCVVFLSTAAVGPAQQPLTVADFDRLHKELVGSKEAWQEIPWRLSIFEAQSAAAKENKPIYMLVRSGHPLGCV